MARRAARGMLARVVYGRTRQAVIAAMLAVGALHAALALSRFRTLHNETFDLAFYARMSWGLVRSDFWDPILNAHVYGLHLSPVLVPLGALGVALGTVPVLLVTQACAVAAAAYPLARIGHRHAGSLGAGAAAFAWLAYPNLGHVASYEFHPGTLAVMPIAWALDALDRGHARHFVVSAVGVLVCREDLALTTLLLGALALRGGRDLRTSGAMVAVGSALYLGLFLFVLHPFHAPAKGSFVLHFGHLGSGFGDVLVRLAAEPSRLWSHLATPPRLAYLPMVLLPLGLLPLIRPAWLLPALPTLAVNLLSQFPDTVRLDSHYLTPAVPCLIAAAVCGLSRAARADADSEVGRARPSVQWRAALLACCVAVAHGIAGGTPVARDFDARSFLEDARSADGRAALAKIPPAEGVLAPYALMPHLAERRVLGPPPPPERTTPWVVLDVGYRARYRGNEDLIRTVEEPSVRSWLARADHGVVLANEHYLVLRRGASPRGKVAAAYLARATEAERSAATPLTRCLGVLDAELDGSRLDLRLVAGSACPPDLALRVGTGHRPRRVELLCDGRMSPAHFRAGDLIRSSHHLTAIEVTRIRSDGLRVGLLRSSGARPEHADPTAVGVAVRAR